MLGKNNTEIWFFITSLSSGGAERNLVHTANYLSKQDFNVYVYTIFDENPLEKELNNNVEFRTLEIPATTIGENGKQVAGAKEAKYYPLAIYRFLREVRNSQPNIIQSYLFYDNTLAKISKLVSPKTKIITGIRSVPNNRSRFRNIVDRITNPLVDHVISNSKAGLSMANNLGVPPENTTVIENAKNTDQFVNATPIDLRDELNLSQESILVGNVARLIERKGHFDLLEAWRKIHKKHNNMHLIIIGDGPEYDSLEVRASELGIEDYIHLLKYRNDVPRLLQAIDYFVFPSHFEGLPGALIEAMAAGLPIVATDIPGNNELIDHGETGLLASPHDPSSLEEELERLLVNPELADKLGSKAQTEAVERFSVKRSGIKHINLYNSLIKYN